MDFHIIIDHPWEGSFNHAVLASFTSGLREGGHGVDVLDLGQVGFDPVLTEAELEVYTQGISLDPMVKDFQERLAAADHLVLIFPIWWNVMPARMKGWCDKVLLPGFAFTNEQVPKPLLNNFRGATVLTTTEVSDEIHREEYHNALYWVLCKGTLEFCGISPVDWLNFGETGHAPQADHDAWLDRVRDMAMKF